VRSAIAKLRAQGLVTPRRRRGTVVRPRQHITLPATRYASTVPTRGPWETACADQGLVGITEVLGISERPADETVATALGLPVGTIVIRRDNHMSIDGCVAQIQFTFLPVSIAAGSPLAAPGKCAGGIYRALAEAGHVPMLADETVGSRMPTPEEAEIMNLDQGSPVIVIERTTVDRGGRAVVHTRLIIDGDRMKLSYRQML